MALQKEMTNEKGQQAAYHKIDRVVLQNGQLRFTLQSYVDAEQRKTAEPVYQDLKIFEANLSEEESMGIRQLCYTKLKSTQKWADAEDC